jgi:hypothetical protein
MCFNMAADHLQAGSYLVSDVAHSFWNYLDPCAYLFSWSLQQKLFMNNDSGTVQMHIHPQGYEHYRRAEVSIQDSTLVASIYGVILISCPLLQIPS